MFRLLTDFNDVRDGCVTGLLEDVQGPQALRVHDRVLLHDDGEHEAWGNVRELANGVVRARIDWSTWGPAGRYQGRAGAFMIVGEFDVTGLRKLDNARGGVPMRPTRRVAA
jgi:hypothetical protein